MPPPRTAHKTNFGFGSEIKRFNTTGIHPQLLTLNPDNSTGPGQYNAKNPDCAYKQKTSSWKTKLASEEFSKFLGFHNPQLLCERVFFRSLGGPGTYDTFTAKDTCPASCMKNKGFGSGERFYNPIKDQTLPPGTHNLKKLTTKFSQLPTLEYDGLQPRFKSTEPKYRQAPNRYNLPHERITDKVVSKRGPYDTFTGPRDGTTIKNHFAPSAFKPPDIFYDVGNELQYLLKHPNKRRCGKFLLDERFPDGFSVVTTKNGFVMLQKDEEYPGPAQYDTFIGIKKAKPSLHPFDSSKKNARPGLNWQIHPGPDRYNIKYPKCSRKPTKGTWTFLSKAKRELVKVESYSNFTY